MTTLVCFHAAGKRYAIPVSSALAVRPSSSVVAIPDERPDVIGVLPGDPVITVFSSLAAGADAAHVLVVTTPEQDFGLLVDAVTEICTIDDAGIRPTPDAGLVVGIAERPDGVVLITDPGAIGPRP